MARVMKSGTQLENRYKELYKRYKNLKDTYRETNLEHGNARYIVNKAYGKSRSEKTLIPLLLLLAFYGPTFFHPQNPEDIGQMLIFAPIVVLSFTVLHLTHAKLKKNELERSNAPEVQKASQKFKETERKNIQTNNMINSVSQELSWLAAGIDGEKKVASVLQRLPAHYYVFNDLGWDKGVEGKSEKQVDHVVIGPKGIVAIETKHYSGKMYPTKDGKWVSYSHKPHRQNTPKKIHEDPREQSKRNANALSRRIGMEVQPMVVLSHAEGSWHGNNYRDNPVLHISQLTNYILEMPGIWSGNQVAIDQAVEKCRLLAAES